MSLSNVLVLALSRKLVADAVEELVLATRSATAAVACCPWHGRSARCVKVFPLTVVISTDSDGAKAEPVHRFVGRRDRNARDERLDRRPADELHRSVGPGRRSWRPSEAAIANCMLNFASNAVFGRSLRSISICIWPVETRICPTSSGLRSWRTARSSAPSMARWVA